MLEWNLELTGLLRSAANASDPSPPPSLLLVIIPTAMCERARLLPLLLSASFFWVIITSFSRELCIADTNCGCGDRPVEPGDLICEQVASQDFPRYSIQRGET